MRSEMFRLLERLSWLPLELCDLVDKFRKFGISYVAEVFGKVDSYWCLASDTLITFTGLSIMFVHHQLESPDLKFGESWRDESA